VAGLCGKSVIQNSLQGSLPGFSSDRAIAAKANVVIDMEHRGSTWVMRSRRWRTKSWRRCRAESAANERVS
jgi:hypothetical protein